jgi:hypothetical protein
MQTNSPVEREQLLDALAEYEWRLSARLTEQARSLSKPALAAILPNIHAWSWKRMENAPKRT